MPLATGKQCAAFFLRKFDVFEDLFHVRFGDGGGVAGGFVERVADGDLFGFFDQRGFELLVDRGFDENALAAEADLALVGERRGDGAVDGLVEIRIGEDDGGVFTAEFERDFFELFGALLVEAEAGARAAGEGNGPDIRVFGDRGADARAGAVQHIKHAGWEASFRRQRREQIGGHRGDFAWLGDDTVSSDERRCKLPGEQQQRQVPRADDGNDADGLA